MLFLEAQIMSLPPASTCQGSTMQTSVTFVIWHDTQSWQPLKSAPTFK